MDKVEADRREEALAKVVARMAANGKAVDHHDLELLRSFNEFTESLLDLGLPESVIVYHLGATYANFCNSLPSHYDTLKVYGWKLLHDWIAAWSDERKEQRAEGRVQPGQNN